MKNIGMFSALALITFISVPAFATTWDDLLKAQQNQTKLNVNNLSGYVVDSPKLDKTSQGSEYYTVHFCKDNRPFQEGDGRCATTTFWLTFYSSTKKTPEASWAGTIKSGQKLTLNGVLFEPTAKGHYRLGSLSNKN